MTDEAHRNELEEILREVKDLAVRYYKITKKPLGVTSEIAEYEASKIPNLTLAVARNPGFDACREIAGKVEKFQIKGRAISLARKYQGRTPRIDCDHEFDAVLLVLLDKQNFDPVEIWRGERAAVAERLARPGSKARDRGSMNISQFKSIARQVWPSENKNCPNSPVHDVQS